MSQLQIFAVSDSVGETAEKIAVASVLQFDIERSITRYSHVTNEDQVMQIVNRAIVENAIIVYTIVKPKLAEFMEVKARETGITVVNVLEPLFEAIFAQTGAQPSNTVGLTHMKDDKYFNRVMAIEYTIDHDNGANLDTVDEADLIILGLPRSSKTPLCMHLANIGIKVANYPITMDAEIPRAIMKLKDKVPMVGLTIDMDTLLELRRERARNFILPNEIDSLNDLVAQEMEYAHRIYDMLNCLVIDVTLMDIEETANTITHKCKLPLQVSYHRFK
jgi:regulator of PEP synthase PpsR (kinase-PPPase family)